MKELLINSVFFGSVISIFAYLVGSVIQKKLKIPIFNPILIAVIIIIFVLNQFEIDYATYKKGAHVISYLLTPATVCLAVPLYEKFQILKNNSLAIVLGLVSGVLASLFSILMLSLLFGLDHEIYVTLLPKSITTAIGIGISEELGGIVTITVASIVMTGILGNMIAVTCCKVFKIEHPVAKGIGIGCSSHAMGTAKAIELGETEGAMSGLAIAVAGLITVIGASIFAEFL